MSNSYSTTIQSLIKHTCQSAGGPNLTHGGSYGEEDGEAGLREGMGKITRLTVLLKEASDDDELLQILRLSIFRIAGAAKLKPRLPMMMKTAGRES